MLPGRFDNQRQLDDIVRSHVMLTAWNHVLLHLKKALLLHITLENKGVSHILAEAI